MAPQHQVLIGLLMFLVTMQADDADDDAVVGDAEKDSAAKTDDKSGDDEKEEGEVPPIPPKLAARVHPCPPPELGSCILALGCRDPFSVALKRMF